VDAEADHEFCIVQAKERPHEPTVELMLIVQLTASPRPSGTAQPWRSSVLDASKPETAGLAQKQAEASASAACSRSTQQRDRS